MENFKGANKLQEDQKHRYQEFQEAIDRKIANRGIAHQLKTTMGSIEVRQQESEAEYKELKTKCTRLKELRQQYYDQSLFGEEDNRYAEMKGLGDLKENTEIAKVILQESIKAGEDMKETAKAISELEEIVQSTVSDYLYRQFNAQIKKHKSDIVKGLKEGLKAIKDKMTGDPESIISDMKANMHADVKGFTSCLTLAEELNKIEQARLKIGEASEDMATANENKNKAYLKALKASYKKTSDEVKNKLPTTVKSKLEEIKPNTMEFETVTSELRELMKIHIAEEKKDKKESSQSEEPKQSKEAFKATQEKNSKNQTQGDNKMCKYYAEDKQCPFHDRGRCRFSHGEEDTVIRGDRGQSREDRSRSRSRSRDRGRSGGDRYKSQDRGSTRDNSWSDRDRDRGRRDRDKDRERGRDRDRLAVVRDKNRDRSRSRDREDRGSRDRERDRSRSTDTAKNLTPNKGTGDRSAATSRRT